MWQEEKAVPKECAPRGENFRPISHRSFGKLFFDSLSAGQIGILQNIALERSHKTTLLPFPFECEFHHIVEKNR